MSTPPEKPVNSIDPFGHVSHETRERVGSEHHPIEGNSEPTRSPYAPTRARERTNAEDISQENDHDAVLSRYAPKKARTQPVQGPDVVTDDDVASLVAPRASERLRGRTERDGVAASESYIASRDPDRWPQPSQRHEHSGSTRPDTGIRDLQRLEAALRTIQREDAAARIPRAAQLPPVSGLAAADTKARRHGIEMLELPRSLEPERMAPPPTMRTRRHRLRAPLMVLVASICSAPIGYYFWTGDWIPPSQPVPEPQMAALGSQTTAQSSARPQDLQQPVARGGDRGTLVQGEGFSQGPETSRQRGSSEGNTVATLQPRPSSDQSPPANKATRVLDPEEIKLLMKQGQQLIAAGDVVTARTVFQRAADAGDADAAIALGATYDPNVLAKLGVIGVRADVEKARNWYQRAEILGSPDARGRLDVLADH
jgi:hypothetical protein